MITFNQKLLEESMAHLFLPLKCFDMKNLKILVVLIINDRDSFIYFLELVFC